MANQPHEHDGDEDGEAAGETECERQHRDQRAGGHIFICDAIGQPGDAETCRRRGPQPLNLPDDDTMVPVHGDDAGSRTVPSGQRSYQYSVKFSSSANLS